MINTTITFYNVGLSDKNLAYDWDALNRILAAGIITDNGQAYKLHLTALPFGQVFNILQDVYDKVKTATYILIENTNPENPDATPDARLCFINNFLQLANGNWSVSYTIDDWASYYLNPDSPYNMHIDGFTERANVPLIDGNNRFKTWDLPLTMGRENSDITFIDSKKLTKPNNHGIALPEGYKCAVYFLNETKFDGNPVVPDILAHGTVLDFDTTSATAADPYRKIQRNNSLTYFMVFKKDNITSNYLNIPIYTADSLSNPTYTELIPGGYVEINEPDDSTIEKIMYFDFIPSDDEITPSYNFQWIASQNKYVIVLHQSDVRERLADICVKQVTINQVRSDIYFKALMLREFAPVMSVDINNFNIIYEDETITKESVYAQYIENSLYKNIDEFRTLKIKFLTAEIELPTFYLINTAKIITGISGDGETVWLKLYHPNFSSDMQSNIFTSTGQNVNYFDLVQVRDFKAYKNAKITGAAGIAATAIGSVVSLGTSIATGNVAGMVGALSGGAQGVIGGIQKLQGLTPAQQSPANGDKTLTEITNDGDNLVYLLYATGYPAEQKSDIINLEENGAAVAMEFNEYMSKCQMQAYNAIKMAQIDITGAPQQICRRIEEMFLSGLTLWTATDVGNKKVINYPRVTVPA